jgi:hypothetical protein
MTTMRRELRKKIHEILTAQLENEQYFENYPIEWTNDTADKLADAILEITGIKTAPMKNASPDWLLAGQVSSEEIARLNEKQQAEKEVLDHYERAMNYPPLSWWTDKKLDRLRKFLLTKTLEQITTFADWCKRDFSSFTPTKARQYPELVIDLWTQAFAPEADNSIRARLERERQNGN